MTIEQLLSFWSQLITTLRWTTLVAFVVIAVVQLFYYIWLNLTVNVQPRTRKAPNAPLMPTNPGAVGSYSAVGTGGGARPTKTTPTMASAPEVFRPHMVILSGLPNVSEIEIPADEFYIGRFYNPEHKILVSLDERSVSRRHAFFHKGSMDDFYLTDTSSSYGTSIKRGEIFEPLTPGKEERIYNGDVVQFGSAISVRFELGGSSRAYATQL